MSQKPSARRRLADLSGRDPDRLSGLSDGIFSVGMTLLVLGLVVPILSGSSTTEGELWDALRRLYYWLKVALVEYWLNIVLLGAALLAGLEYGLRARLFQEEDRSDMAFLMRGRILIAQSLYACATVLCLIFPTWVSIALIILIQVNYVLAPRIPFLHRF